MYECHVHAGIDPADIGEMRAQYPDSDFLIHPECGCVTQTMYRLGEGDIEANGTKILSTEGMVKHAKTTRRTTLIVATETGILHRLQKEAPDKEFIAANRGAVCQFMKRITLPKVLWSLEE